MVGGDAGGERKRESNVDGERKRGRCGERERERERRDLDENREEVDAKK